MPRRPSGKTSRAIGTSALPTPIQSTFTTPLSSAYPSTYASEVEWDPEDDPTLIPISTLILSSPSVETTTVATGKAKTSKPFPFMALPSELRVKIYGYHFAGTGRVIDLDSDNYKRIYKKLAILRVCRTIYLEASYYFYSTHTVRVFPTDGRFHKTKKPLLARLKPKQRACITSLELRLGPGWNRPPRSWVVNAALGLRDCSNVRSLTVFVECDPSDGFFKGFRRADGFYEGFSRNLLEKVLEEMPALDRVYFDAWTGVKQCGAMMKGLLEVTLSRGRKICWGPERGWTDVIDEKEGGDSETALSLAGPRRPDLAIAA